METVNIVVNLSLAISLIICVAFTVNIIRRIYGDITDKTKAHAALAIVSALLTTIVFTSLAIQTAALWETSRVWRGCDK